MIWCGNETIFKLTPQYWTVNMFKRAINALTKKLPQGSWLSGIKIEDGTSPEQCTLVIDPNNSLPDHAAYVNIYVSEGFKRIFKTSGTEFKIYFEKQLKVPINITAAEEDSSQWKIHESYKRLSNNYYPTISSLITELDTVCRALKLEIDTQRRSSTAAFTFFSVENNSVKFSGKAGYSILLSTNLLKLFHLPTTWLTNSIIGSGEVVMKSYKRSHLYVHLDCLDYHYINNNVSDLIKVVSNTAAIDEKLQLTFSDPHYYSVAKRYLSTINMFITDNFFDGILQFDRDIVYTLHSRKCPHSL